MTQHFSTDETSRAWYLRLSQIAEEVLKPFKLRTPTISFSADLETIHGKWLPASYEIRLSTKSFCEYPWELCINIFKHELAHLIADECFEGKYETAHGPSFQRACKTLGISPEATLRSPQKQIQTSRKIAKLLKLAESSNLNESRNAAAKAQQLINRYNVKEDAKEFSFRSIGQSFKRCPIWHSKIISICSKYFFVQAFKNYSEKESVYFFEFYGEIHNLDSAQFIYNFLLTGGERHWLANKEKGARKDHFLLGFYDGFEETLKNNSSAAENSLIHLRNPALQSFFKKLNPHTKSISYRKRSIQSSYEKGKKLGRNLNIPEKLDSKHEKRFIIKKN